VKETLDFLIIGAQKAGTTALFQYLRHHPEVHIPDRKEEPFFSHDFPAIPHRSWSEYLSDVFAGAPEEAVWGTATPQYMAGSLLKTETPELLIADPRPERIVPERIRQRMPDVRLIAILRDPVERAVSQHRMEHAMGVESRSFEETIAELLEPEALERSRHVPTETNTYVVYGEYARILQGYYDTFEGDQILVLFTEDLEHEPEAAVRAIFSHIGVDSRFTPPNLGTRYFSLSSSGRFPWLKPRSWEQAASRSRVLRAAWHKLPQRARTAVLRPWWEVSHRVFVWNATARDTDESQPPPPSAPAHTELAKHYAEDSAHLTRLTGRVPPWASGHGAPAATQRVS
jgi:hypothetical protein